MIASPPTQARKRRRRGGSGARGGLVGGIFGEDREPDGVVVDLLEQGIGGGRASLARVAPRIEVNQRARRQSIGPLCAGEYGAVGKLADVADAQIGDGNDVIGDAENFGERVVAHDADPSHPQALGACREPKIFDRQARRVNLDIANAGLAEHGGTEAIGLAGDDKVERSFEDAFELEREIFFAALAAELSRIFLALGFEDFLHAPAPLEAAHDDEVPRLREADTGGMMRRGQHARQHIVGNWIGNELPDVAAAEDRLVEAALEQVGEGVAIGRIGRHEGRDLSRADASVTRPPAG